MANFLKYKQGDRIWMINIDTIKEIGHFPNGESKIYTDDNDGCITIKCDPDDLERHLGYSGANIVDFTIKQS